ncbi:hypothetical protein HPB47_004491, partial [Ixodes persulcatus]
ASIKKNTSYEEYRRCHNQRRTDSAHGIPVASPASRMEALRVQTGRCVARRVGPSGDPRPSALHKPEDETMGGRVTQRRPELTAIAGNESCNSVQGR